MTQEEYFNEGTPFKSMAQGEISKSMGIDTKPAHKFEINGYWVMVDPKMSKACFEYMRDSILGDFEMFEDKL